MAYRLVVKGSVVRVTSLLRWLTPGGHPSTCLHLQFLHDALYLITWCIICLICSSCIMLSTTTTTNNTRRKHDDDSSRQLQYAVLAACLVGCIALFVGSCVVGGVQFRMSPGACRAPLLVPASRVVSEMALCMRRAMLSGGCGRHCVQRACK